MITKFDDVPICDRTAMATIIEDEDEKVEEVEQKTEQVGDIIRRMSGDISASDLVERNKAPVKIKPAVVPTPKAKPKQAPSTTGAAGAADWREEVKKRERAKQVAKLSEQSDKELEKAKMPDWRDAILKNEDDNPINKYLYSLDLPENPNYLKDIYVGLIDYR